MIRKRLPPQISAEDVIVADDVTVGDDLTVSDDALISGDLTVTGTVGASNLSGTNTGNVTLATVGSAPNSSGASLSGQALTLQPADGSNPGLVTTGAQTFAGVKTFSSTPVIPVPAWTAPSLAGTWVNFAGGYNDAGYYKDETGRVWLRGAIKDGGIGNPAFTLAAGSRPTANAIYTVCVDQGTGEVGTVLVTPDGQVTPNSATTDDFFSLEGVSFLTT